MQYFFRFIQTITSFLPYSALAGACKERVAQRRKKGNGRCVLWQFRYKRHTTDYILLIRSGRIRVMDAFPEKRTGRKSPGGSYVPPGTQEGGMTYDGRISKREKGDGDIRSWPDNPLEAGESGQDTGNKLEWEEDVLPGGCNADGRQGE